MAMRPLLVTSLQAAVKGNGASGQHGRIAPALAMKLNWGVSWDKASLRITQIWGVGEPERVAVGDPGNAGLSMDITCGSLSATPSPWLTITLSVEWLPPRISGSRAIQ